MPSIYAAGDATGRAAVHARRRASGGRRRTRRVLPGSWPGRRRGAVGDVHRSNARPRRADQQPKRSDRFGARRVRVHRWSLDHNDRAHVERASGGAIVLVERVGGLRSRLVGANVLAPGAGEVINELVVAIEQRMSVADLAGVVHVYPTVATSVQQLAGRAAVARAASLSLAAGTLAEEAAVTDGTTVQRAVGVQLQLLRLRADQRGRAPAARSSTTPTPTSWSPSSSSAAHTPGRRPTSTAGCSSRCSTRRWRGRRSRSRSGSR